MNCWLYIKLRGALILLICGLCMSVESKVPCIDNCDKPTQPICAFDGREGARIFDNLCVMNAWNLCYKTEYEIQGESDVCHKMYREEYSRESKISYKNPFFMKLYGDKKIDNLYL